MVITAVLTVIGGFVFSLIFTNPACIPLGFVFGFITGKIITEIANFIFEHCVSDKNKIRYDTKYRLGKSYSLEENDAETKYYVICANRKNKKGKVYLFSYYSNSLGWITTSSFDNEIEINYSDSEDIEPLFVSTLITHKNRFLTFLFGISSFEESLYIHKSHIGDI